MDLRTTVPVPESSTRGGTEVISLNVDTFVLTLPGMPEGWLASGRLEFPL